MNPSELLRIVDTIHRDKNIDKEIVFEGIEAALVSAAKRHYGEESDIAVRIDREDGSVTSTLDGVELDPEETVGRIGAQTAKQVMIQKIREAERDALHDEYTAMIGQMVTGIIQRYTGGSATVALSNVEALLPRSEQIPGETHHTNERVRTTVCEVRKVGTRVKVILSRTRSDLVRCLFEQEIPEVAEGIIEIRGIAREPSYRTKVGVTSSDARVDCIGACVGSRGNRIKNVVDELAGERIDIVRWSDDMQELIPNALQPAEVEEVILCQMLGRAIVLVREDQLSLAIGRRGQNVRLASKLCIWDIEIMTREELDEQIDVAVAGFSSLEGVDENLSERLVGEGYLSYDDLTIIEPDALMEMGGLTMEQVDKIVEQAEVRAAEAEKVATEQRRLRREQERAAAAEAAESAKAAERAESEGESTTPEADAGDESDSGESDSGESDSGGGDEPKDEAPEQESSESPIVAEEAATEADPTDASVEPPAEDSEETSQGTAS